MRETLEEIGICYLASYLREKGVEVMLLQTREKNIDFEKIVDFNQQVIGLSIYEKSRKAVYRVSEHLKKY